MSNAFYNNNLGVARLILEKGLVTCTETDLSRAASRGYNQVVQFLLDHGVDPIYMAGRTLESSALACAMLGGHEACVQILLGSTNHIEGCLAKVLQYRNVQKHLV